jgi:hypothetical protein
MTSTTGMALVNSLPSSKDAPGGGREIYYEFAKVGAYVKVSAIYVPTGMEVSVVGPATASQADLQRLARMKLMRKLNGL